MRSRTEQKRVDKGRLQPVLHLGQSQCIVRHQAMSQLILMTATGTSFFPRSIFRRECILEGGVARLRVASAVQLAKSPRRRPQGKYYPLAGSQSYLPTPGGMSADQEEEPPQPKSLRAREVPSSPKKAPAIGATESRSILERRPLSSSFSACEAWSDEEHWASNVFFLYIRA